MLDIFITAHLFQFFVYAARERVGLYPQTPGDAEFCERVGDVLLERQVAELLDPDYADEDSFDDQDVGEDV